MNEPKPRTSNDQALPCLVALIGFAAFGWWAWEDLKHGRAGPRSNETVAIGSLKTLAVAQSLFREADSDRNGTPNYATLEELGALTDANGEPAALIDSVLASGTKSGYLFEATYGAQSSEFLWFATARPITPGESGERYFAANQDGIIYYTVSGPFRLNGDDFRIPAGVPRVGR